MTNLRTALAFPLLLTFATPPAVQHRPEETRFHHPERRPGPGQAPQDRRPEPGPSHSSHHTDGGRPSLMDPQGDRLPERPRGRDLEAAKDRTREFPRSRFEKGPSRPEMAPPMVRRREPLPAYQPPTRSRDEVRRWQQGTGWRRNAWAPHPTWGEHRAHHWEAEHRTWSQRGGYGGYCVPEPQFRRHFGDLNTFRLRARPVIYGGYPRFRYNGFWILIVDPWPEFWLEDWYLDDDLYIDYRLDGYYLFSRRHPGISLAVAITL